MDAEREMRSRIQQIDAQLESEHERLAGQFGWGLGMDIEELERERAALRKRLGEVTPADERRLSSHLRGWIILTGAVAVIIIVFSVI